jgi:hypothetical protein
MAEDDKNASLSTTTKHLTTSFDEAVKLWRLTVLVKTIRQRRASFWFCRSPLLITLPTSSPPCQLRVLFLPSAEQRKTVLTSTPSTHHSFHGGGHTHKGILCFIAPSIHPPIDWLIVVLFVGKRDVVIASYRFLQESSLLFANSCSSGSHTISQHKTLSNDR